MLQEYGIEMSFYGEDGKFSGVENMLAQLAKLRKLDPLQQQKALNLMFGVEAGRPAQILTQQGLEKYQANLALIDSQANIQQRVNEKLDTFAGKLEALGGTFENTIAKMARPIGEALKPVMSVTTDLLSGAGNVFDENPNLGAGMLVAGAGMGIYGGMRTAGAVKGWMTGGRGAAAGATAANPVSYKGLWEAERAAQRASIKKWTHIGGKLVPLAAFGLESYDALTDESLTAEGRARGVMRAATGGIGGWAGAASGAAAGAAIGSVVPVVGTAIGGVVGGVAGGMGGYSLFQAGFDKLRPVSVERDLVKLTAPTGTSVSQFGNGSTLVEVGRGELRLDLRVTDERISLTPTVVQSMPLLHIDAGNTNPGAFPSAGGGAR